MKLGLITVSVFLLVSLAANAYLYFIANSNLQKEVVELQSKVTDLESQIVNLQGQMNSLQANYNIKDEIITNLNKQILGYLTENEYLKTENSDLLSQIKAFNQTPTNVRQAYLVTRLGVKYIEIQPNINSGVQNSLYVQGEVWNTGNGTAYNSQLEVISFIMNGTSFTDYIYLGTIPSGSYVDVDTHIYHADITRWQLIPMSANIP